MKKERTQFIISAAMIIADFLMIMLMSILSLDFSWDKLKEPLLWFMIVINQFAVLIAYFATINLGENHASKEVEVVELVDNVNNQFKNIDITYLSSDFSEFIRIENLKSLCWSYLEIINKKLRKKIADGTREELIKEKDKCLDLYNYYADLNSAKECSKPDNDFDILTKKIRKRKIIHEKFFVCEKESFDTRNVGSIDKTKTITNDSVKKICTSLIITIVFQSINPEMINSGWNAIYQLVWRCFLIAFNVYCGFQEGKKIILVNKVFAFNERQKILNQFFNKMFLLGKIKAQ